VQWIIDKLLKSEIAIGIMEDLLLPVSWAYEGWRRLKAAAKSKNYKPVLHSLKNTLESLNDHVAAPVLYMALYSHIAGILRFGVNAICLSLGASVQVTQTVANGAGRVLHHGAKATGKTWNAGVSFVKKNMGGVTENVDRVIERQKFADLGAGIPYFHEWCEQIHRTLMILMRTLGDVSSVGLKAFSGLNDQLESVQNSGYFVDRLTEIMTEGLASLDNSPVGKSMEYFLGGGTASILAATMMLPKNMKEVRPQAMRAFVDFEKDELDDVVEEAYGLRPEVKSAEALRANSSAGGWIPWEKAEEEMKTTHIATRAFEDIWQGQDMSSSGRTRIPSVDRIPRMSEALAD
jgi:hypothetical protein